MITNTKKLDSSLTGITLNYVSTLESIENKINTNNYVLKINGTPVINSKIYDGKVDFSHLTNTGRKKVAKRLYNYEKKGSLKTINFLFHVLNKMNVIQDKITIHISNKEREIQELRKTYVKLRSETETARLAYKLTKGDFYK